MRAFPKISAKDATMPEALKLDYEKTESYNALFQKLKLSLIHI